MPDGVAPLESKSPKTPRRVKTPAGDPHAAATATSTANRRVHFGDLEQTTAAQSFAANKDSLKINNIPGVSAAPPPSSTAIPVTAAAAAAAPGEQTAAATANQPSNFPALVPPAGLAGGPWFTSQRPGQSVSQPQIPQPHFPQVQQQPGLNVNTATFTPPHCQVHFQHHHQQQQPHHPVAFVSMAYSNATPPLTGMNFQPPVPDTTNGPMNHVYIPRFDNGVVVDGVQHPLPPGVQHVGFSPLHPPSLPCLPRLSRICYPTPPAAAAVFTHSGPKVHPAGFVPYCYPATAPKTFYSYLYRQQPTVGQVPIQQQAYYVQAQPSLHVQPQVQGQTYYVGQPPLLVNGQPQMMAAGPGPQLHVAPGPAFVQQPGLHPAMCVQQAMPFAAASSGPAPDITGLGRTQGEETIRQLNFAHANRMFETQDFKPSDDDPSRYYYVRELDGNWTQRNRFSIDHMGDCRWYVTDEGWFYAVRLPN